MKRLRAVASALATASRSGATQSAYASDCRDFERWCLRARRKPLPATPETLMLYVASQLETHRVSSVERRVAAIADAHRVAGARSPSPKGGPVCGVLAGARRGKKAPSLAKAALRPEDLRHICVKLQRSHGRVAVRDRALLVIGFAAGMRRSELAGLDLADVQFVRQGLLVTIRRGKTDQEGKGRSVGIFRGSRASTCPVRSLVAWLKVRGKKPGPLFPGGPQLSGSRGSAPRLVGASINNIVRRAVKLVGLDPKLYGAHSLRSGFVTAAAEAGMPETLIMQRTGHRSVQTVARYVRPATAFSSGDVLRKAL